MEYKDKLNLLSVTELRKFIKDYNLQMKIVMTRKKKDELITEILKHTKLENGKVSIISHNIDGNIEPKPKAIKESKPKAIKEPIKKVEESNEEVVMKHKIIDGFKLFIIEKNFEKASELFRDTYSLERTFKEYSNDIMNDEIENWFDTYDDYNKFISFFSSSSQHKDLYLYLTTLKEIENLNPKQKTKLKKLKIVAVDESQIEIRKGRIQDGYNIFFDYLDFNTGFETEMRDRDSKIKKIELYSKELPNEAQIFDVLKNNNIKFDYYYYIFKSLLSSGGLSRPSYNIEGKGYNKDKGYLYDKNGKLVEKIRDGATSGNRSVLKYLVKNINKL